jgi:hypothetical protein
MPLLRPSSRGPTPIFSGRRYVDRATATTLSLAKHRCGARRRRTRPERTGLGILALAHARSGEAESPETSCDRWEGRRAGGEVGRCGGAASSMSHQVGCSGSPQGALFVRLHLRARGLWPGAWPMAPLTRLGTGSSFVACRHKPRCAHLRLPRGRRAILKRRSHACLRRDLPLAKQAVRNVKTVVMTIGIVMIDARSAAGPGHPSAR